MKMAFAALLGLIAVPLFSADLLNPDTLSNNGMVRMTTQGEAPFRGCDVKAVFDTAGNMYMIGGCTFYGYGEGSHNSDLFRIDVRTGAFNRLYTNATNPWKGGCQAGHAYDPSRNCVWFGNGSFSGHDTFSGPVPGIWRFQCPDGPASLVADGYVMGTGGGFEQNAHYWHYDPGTDQVIGLCASLLILFNGDTHDTTRVRYPFGSISLYEIPSCFDSKRGLLAVTLATSQWDPTLSTNTVLRDVWFFSPALKTWHKKTPASIPGFTRGELDYDSKNDRYVYFGSGAENGCVTEIWSYDYESNAWTRSDPAGRFHNPASPMTGTWPAQRFKGTWAYSGRDNVHVNWGGHLYGPWDTSGTTCADYYEAGARQPLWIYRLAVSGADIETGSPGYETNLEVSPNPFQSVCRLSIRSAGRTSPAVTIYSAGGRLIRRLQASPGTGNVSWNATGLPSGVYVARIAAGNRSLEKRLLLVR